MKFAKRYDVYADKLFVGSIVGEENSLESQGKTYKYFQYKVVFPDLKEERYDESLDELSVFSAAEYLIVRYKGLDETYEIRLVPANQETTPDGGN